MNEGGYYEALQINPRTGDCWRASPGLPTKTHSFLPVSRPRVDRAIIHRLPPSPTPAQRFSTVPSIHRSTKCKKSSWKLPIITKRVVILGDSNVSRITESKERDIQVDSYPGAKIRNLEQMMMHPAETDGTHPEIVILSVGINDRANKPSVTTIPNLRRMAARAGKCFPHSIIAIPEINFSDRLPLVEQEYIMRTSESLLDIKGIVVIPKLEESSFKTDTSDNIHWTPETANKMLTHWLCHLN